ncbi:unnamed protein product [Caenorhabditis bovis]|uniref:RBR-type E3 ubiquitin transferase n=1 Tax=Caenorhabditis bovis TaxID=2654633 RepID=A0A8S1EFI9_9PELO|nr:unnamed protein product [Caenorhabditis bovis]
MAVNKSGLDPLVECSEEDAEPEKPVIRKSNPRQMVARSHSRSVEVLRARSCPRATIGNLFSFSAIRERARALGWRQGDIDDSSNTMTTVSNTDARSPSSVSSKRQVPIRIIRSMLIFRNRESDASSLADGAKDPSADLLLQEEVDSYREIMELRNHCIRFMSGEEVLKGGKLKECPLCAAKLPIEAFPKIKGCQHRSCIMCLRHYVELSIRENRVEVSCPECSSFFTPADIYKILADNVAVLEKYEQFSIRKYLLSEADARWCPAPDCNYAVIATRCAACPKIKCGRPECGTYFCYHCKREWHNNQTCDEARRSERRKSKAIAFEEVFRNGGFIGGTDTLLKPGDVKACPRCHTYIVKMDDGSCNHMVCTMCTAEFCWLCLKEISDLHYLSPTGCTFWGKKPWTRKKKLLWQLGTLIGAPVGIALIAGLSIPGIIFGVPVFVGRKVHNRFHYQTKWKRRFLTAVCVMGSLVVSPVMAVMAVGVGVPILLAYVYGVVPLSLCRNGGCGISSSNSDPAFNDLDEEQLYGIGEKGLIDMARLQKELKKEDGTSVEPSINSGLSAPTDAKGKIIDTPRRRASLDSAERTNYEEASVRAMAGSHYNDDKSLHTLGSGHEVTSINEDKAMNSETKSMSESIFRSVLGRQLDSKKDEIDEAGEEDGHDDDEPCSSASALGIKKKPSTSSGARFSCVIDMRDENVVLLDEGTAIHQPPARGSAEAPIDLCKIRSWLDNMKYMVATDVSQERPYEPSIRPGSKLRRSGSGKSVHTVLSGSIGVTSASGTSAMDVSGVQNSASSPKEEHEAVEKKKKKKRFYSNWFSKSK